MKHILLTTIAAVVLVGCGPSVDIHESARTGNIEAVKQAIAAGADVNAKTEDGWTPLHGAAVSGKNEIVELLIAEGADINAKMEDDRTPLDWATGNHRTELADLLRKHGGKHGTIHGVARGGDIEAVKEFLAVGADVNAKDDEFGTTPLHLAVQETHKEIVELLIAKGANVNVKDDGGKTPLDYAEGEIADLLRKHGGKTGEELKAEGK